MVRAAAPRPVQFGDPVLSVAHRELRRAIESLGSAEILDGRHIGDTVLTNNTVNRLAHKLGRKLTGWIITDLRGATATGRIVRVLSSGSSTADDSKDLWLDVQGMGANITVRLWVF